MSTFENRLPEGRPIFLTPDEKAVIRRYAILCQLWRRGDRGFPGLEYDLGAGCGILAGRIAISTSSRHIIAADLGDRAFHAAIFYNDRVAVPEITTTDLLRLRRYIIHRKGALPVANPLCPGIGERRRTVAGFVDRLRDKKISRALSSSTCAKRHVGRPS